MEQLNTIKELISQGNVEQAILLLDELLQTDFPQKDEAYYLQCAAMVYRRWNKGECPSIRNRT